MIHCLAVESIQQKTAIIIFFREKASFVWSYSQHRNGLGECNKKADIAEMFSIFPREGNCNFIFTISEYFLIIKDILLLSKNSRETQDFKFHLWDIYIWPCWNNRYGNYSYCKLWNYKIHDTIVVVRHEKTKCIGLWTLTEGKHGRRVSCWPAFLSRILFEAKYRK